MLFCPQSSQDICFLGFMVLSTMNHLPPVICCPGVLCCLTPRKIPPSLLQIISHAALFTPTAAAVGSAYLLLCQDKAPKICSYLVSPVACTNCSFPDT